MYIVHVTPQFALRRLNLGYIRNITASSDQLAILDERFVSEGLFCLLVYDMKCGCLWCFRSSCIADYGYAVYDSHLTGISRSYFVD